MLAGGIIASVNPIKLFVNTLHKTEGVDFCQNEAIVRRKNVLCDIRDFSMRWG